MEVANLLLFPPPLPLLCGPPTMIPELGTKNVLLLEVVIAVLLLFVPF